MNVHEKHWGVDYSLEGLSLTEKREGKLVGLLAKYNPGEYSRVVFIGDGEGIERFFFINLCPSLFSNKTLLGAFRTHLKRASVFSVFKGIRYRIEKNHTLLLSGNTVLGKRAIEDTDGHWRLDGFSPRQTKSLSYDLNNDFIDFQLKHYTPQKPHRGKCFHYTDFVFCTRTLYINQYNDNYPTIRLKTVVDIGEQRQGILVDGVNVYNVVSGSCPHVTLIKYYCDAVEKASGTEQIRKDPNDVVILEPHIHFNEATDCWELLTQTDCWLTLVPGVNPTDTPTVKRSLSFIHPEALKLPNLKRILISYFVKEFNTLYPEEILWEEPEEIPYSGYYYAGLY